jgi:ribosomal protein L34
MEDQPDRSSAVTMPVKVDRLRKSDIRSQNKRTIYNVYKFFKDISEQPEPFSNINVHKTQEITARACGVHRSTVQKVCNEAFNSSSGNQVFASPRKLYNRKHVTDMNDFGKEVLCRTAYEFYDKGEYPTASKLRKIMEEKIWFSRSQSSILRLLRKMGFRYRRCNDGRKFLMERRDTVTRMEFLRTMHNIRSSGDTQPIFYLDEMWVNQNHSLIYIYGRTLTAQVG